MATTNFGATANDVLNMLPGTVVADFDASGSSSTPAGQAEIQAELDRQERAIRARMSSDLTAKVNAASGTIPALADCCAQCAAARLGMRVEAVDGGTAPIHVQQLAADCETTLSLIAQGRFTPPGLGTNDPAPEPRPGYIQMTRA